MEFFRKIIQKYLNAIKSTGINYVELGFRFNEEKIKGLTAYTDKKLINKLKVPKSIQLGIMLNASDLINKNKFQFSVLKKLVNKNNSKKLKFVRLACHHHEVFYLNDCLDYFKKLNLDVFINIMQISEIDLKLLKKISSKLKNYNIKALYLADSLGALKALDLKNIFKILKKYWGRDIGLHAHDNLKLALDNSIFAINQNVKWIDCTITGMGRGPGNLKTEDIIKYSKNHIYTPNSKL